MKKVVSFYLESNYSFDYEKVSLACKVFPSNWRACLSQVKLDLNKKNIEAAKKTLNQILVASPFNFSAIQLWSVAAFQERNIFEGCYALWVYGSIFKDQNQVIKDLEKTCPKYLIQDFSIESPFLYFKLAK